MANFGIRSASVTAKIRNIPPRDSADVTHTFRPLSSQQNSRSTVNFVTRNQQPGLAKSAVNRFKELARYGARVSCRSKRGTGLRLPLVGVGIVIAAAAGLSAGAGAKVPPLRDPVFLNIGFVCQWQEGCMQKQQRAHKRSLSFIKKAKPPAWKVQFCNRRATFRRTGRIDWISYHNCISNPKLASSTSTASARTRRQNGG